MAYVTSKPWEWYIFFFFFLPFLFSTMSPISSLLPTFGREWHEDVTCHKWLIYPIWTRDDWQCCDSVLYHLIWHFNTQVDLYLLLPTVNMDKQNSGLIKTLTAAVLAYVKQMHNPGKHAHTSCGIFMEGKKLSTFYSHEKKKISFLWLQSFYYSL